MRDSSLSTIYLHFFFELFRSALFPSIVVVFFLTLLAVHDSCLC